MLGSCSNFMYHIMYFLIRAVGSIGLDLPSSSLTVQPSQTLALAHSLVYFGYRNLYCTAQVAGLPKLSKEMATSKVTACNHCWDKRESSHPSHSKSARTGCSSVTTCTWLTCKDHIGVNIHVPVLTM